MVYFTDITTSRQSFLVILDNNKQDVESGTRLQDDVDQRDPYKQNESAHHQSNKETTPLITLGRRIAEGIANWGDDVKFFGEFHYVKGYWEWTEDVLSRHEGKLRDKIAKTPIDSISSLEHEIRTGFSSIKGFPHDFDLTQLEEDINMLFAAATAYDTARSLSHECGEDSAQRLRDVKTALSDARVKEKKEADYIKPIKKELADLEIRKGELMKSLEEHQALLRVIQQDVKNHEEEIEQVKNAPILDGEVLEELKNSEHQLQRAQRSLEDQNPFA